MNNTKIEWCDDTVNPWIGCAKVSQACTNCYAESLDKRLRFGGQTNWGAGGNRLIRVDAAVAELARIAKRAEKDGRPRRVFIASMADVFEDRPDLVEPRARLWEALKAVNRDGVRVVAMLLTKRAAELLAWQREVAPFGLPSWCWVGVTVEDQQRAVERVGNLLRVRVQAGGVRFVSCEPLLGPVDLRHIDIDDDGKDPWMCQVDALTGRHTDMARPCPDVPILHWVIAGGESGPKARPMHPDWARSLREQCAAAGTAFHFKQWGEWAPRGCHKNEAGLETWQLPGADNHPRVRLSVCGCNSSSDRDFSGVPGAYRRHECDLSRDSWVQRVGKKAAGRLLDGVEHDGVPSVSP